jgi:hypothetical protein
VDAPALTWSASRCLFAAEWAPAPESSWKLAVPGGTVDGPITGGNLLNVALSNLRQQGVLSFEQLRPVAAEPVIVLGGDPFSRFTLSDPGQELRGLEGVLLKAARAFRDADVRGLILSLSLASGSPWGSVAACCYSELGHAGLIELKGFLSKKPVLTNPSAVEAARPRDAEVVAERQAIRALDPDLDDAVLGDCLAALRWAHSTPHG